MKICPCNHVFPLRLCWKYDILKLNSDFSLNVFLSLDEGGKVTAHHCYYLTVWWGKRQPTTYISLTCLLAWPVWVFKDLFYSLPHKEGNVGWMDGLCFCSFMIWMVQNGDLTSVVHGLSVCLLWDWLSREIKRNSLLRQRISRV